MTPMRTGSGSLVLGAGCLAIIIGLAACSGSTGATTTAKPVVPAAQTSGSSRQTQQSELSWTHVSTNTPPLPRNAAGFSYDVATKNIVLTGGLTGCGAGAIAYTDTWTLSGSSWQRQPADPNSPSPGGMQSFTTAYDPDTSTVIALGIYSGCGVSTGMLSWDGTRWTRAPSDLTLPTPMFSRGLAYDESARRLIAVGLTAPYSGEPANGPQGMETWAYGGGAWTKLSAPSSLPQLIGMSVAYDARLGEVILFGGAPQSKPTGPAAAAHNETWALNGTSWSRIATPVSPPPRVDTAMVYDPAIGATVIFGGASTDPSVQDSNPEVFDDMWTFDGTTWRQLHPPVVPPGRLEAQMAYDSDTGQIVLFGGSRSATTDSNDTWTFGGH